MALSSDASLKVFLAAVFGFAMAGCTRKAVPAAAAPKQMVIEQEAPVTRSADEAREKAIKYLYKMQKGNNWELAPAPSGDNAASFAAGQWGWLTALAVNGLTAGGVNSQQEHMKRAIEFLASADVKGTRALAMKAVVSNSIIRPSHEQKAVAKKDITLLLDILKTTGPDAGLFGFTSNVEQSGVDLIVSNDVNLAMRAAMQGNQEIPASYWQLIEKAWRNRQAKDGGWGEGIGATPGRATATAAGLATLFRTQQALNRYGGDCKGNSADSAISAGVKWLDDHAADILREPNLPYLLFTLSRVAQAGGYKYFGTLDWYHAGITQLLKTQKADGSWDGPDGPIAATAWALQALEPSFPPIAINKLAYDTDGQGRRMLGNWNQRPRDIANFSQWAGNQLCYDALPWHVIDFSMSADDFHDAPILYMAGNQKLNFTPVEKAKLRDFVLQGGLIVGNADCGAQSFKNAFDELGKDLFPDYPFRPLPDDHLILNEMFRSATWKTAPARPQGLSNGAREFMILLENDPALFWNIANFQSSKTKPLAELMLNIYCYTFSSRPNQLVKLPLVRRDEKVQVKQTIKIARLQHKGTWDPEPGGWVQFTNRMHNDRAIDLDVQPMPLGQGKLTIQFPIAHLTGIWNMQLEPAQRDELKAYIENGGMLVIDCAGGAEVFCKSARLELGAMFPALVKQLDAGLPLEHAVYTKEATKITEVQYRNYARKIIMGNLKTPRLRGIEIGGRTAVFFSEEDLSVGLVGTNVDGIIGYEPAWANALMANVIEYAAKKP